MFILQVGVVYIHTAYSWPAALTLCASLVVLMTQFAGCNGHTRVETINLCLE